MSVKEIKITNLDRIAVRGGAGDVLHCMKKTDPGFIEFGEAYFSLIEYKAIKAWKKHLKMTLNLVVPVGQTKFVFFDKEGNTREEFIGSDRYLRLTVPPGIWFGFQGMSKSTSLILNIASMEHDPLEVERKDLEEINYPWSLS
jgi:dTDP-4-dehydrorhamnose 3,5-epimerase